METGGSSLEIILWVGAAPVILLLVAFGLTLWWRKMASDAVSELGEEIQGFDSRLEQIGGFLHSYAHIDQEPYATHLDELQRDAAELRTQIESFIETCQAFEQETRQAGFNRLQNIINAPFNAFGRWRRSADLRAEGKVISNQLAESEEHMRRIYELPLDLAKECQQAEKDAAELFQLTQALQLKNARGPALDEIAGQVPQIRRALAEIPAVFLQADAEGLLAASNLAPSIRVFETVNRVRPALDRSLPRVREWNATYDKAAADYSELKVQGASLRQAITKPPSGLVITALEERLDQVAQMATDLSKRLSQPQVEDLKPLAREISQIKRVIQDSEQQLSRASTQVNELNKVLADLHNGLEKLAGQIGEMEHSDIFPLAWDSSSGLVNELRKRLEALGPAQQPRTPDQVSQHLKELEGIRSGHQTHAEAFPKIAEQHRALVALLESSEIREGSTWLHQARDMLAQAGVYDPRNWSKTDSIQTLPTELEELNQMYEGLIPAERSAPIRETELSQRLKDTVQLMEHFKRLRPRIESVQTRLAKVKAMEDESKEKLSAAYSALERVDLLAENNELLDEISKEEIDRLINEIRQAGNELNARGQGEMDKKAQRINALTEKVNKALNAWLARLNAAIGELGGQINGMLIQLDAIALLDEAAVNDARKMLASDEYTTTLYGSRGSGRTGQTGGLRGVAAKVAERSPILPRAQTLGDLEATAEIKRKNDLWLTLRAAQQALNEKTESLLDAYTETMEARGAAQEMLAEITRRLPDRRAWPPSNQSQPPESQTLQPVDAKREMMKKQAMRVELAILELGRLARQYQLAGEHARQILDRVTQDEERVQDLEEQIREIKQRWQTLAQSDPNNYVMHEGVQHLMSQTDSKLAFIKQQFMRGSISYEQVIHNLQLLYDELFSARVSVDDKNDIGLNESHSTNGKRAVNQR